MNDSAGPQTDGTGAPVETSLLPDGESYGVFFPGDAYPVGRAYFLDRDGGQRIFHHTVVSEEFSGRGLGSALVSAALEDARVRGWTVVPVCPYVSAWIRKNGWNGPVSPVTDDVIDWVADQD